VLLLTLAVTASVAVRGGAAKALLVIDEVERTITLPGRGRRAKGLTVPFDAVEEVQVDEKLGRDSDGDPIERYEVVLHYREGDSTRRERLVEKHERAQAEALAAWIEDQLRGGPWR